MSIDFEEMFPSKNHPWLFDAWLAFVSFAVRKEEILAHFEEDTGNKVPRPRNGIEAMVDEACGYSPYEEYLKKLIPWLNVNYWGDVDADDESDNWHECPTEGKL